MRIGPSRPISLGPNSARLMASYPTELFSGLVMRHFYCKIVIINITIILTATQYLCCVCIHTTLCKGKHTLVLQIQFVVLITHKVVLRNFYTRCCVEFQHKVFKPISVFTFPVYVRIRRWITPPRSKPSIPVEISPGKTPRTTKPQVTPPPRTKPHRQVES
jgi:hypothetical protein